MLAVHTTIEHVSRFFSYHKDYVKYCASDVVNLSSQLVSMEILTQKKSRKGKKRVRFAIPDEDVCREPSCKKTRAPVMKIKLTVDKTYYLRKKLVAHNIHGNESHRNPLKLDRSRAMKNDSNVLVGDASALSQDTGIRQFRLKTQDVSCREESNDVVVRDVNQNCAVKSDNRRSPKGSRVVLRKSKSDSSLHDKNYRATCKPTKKKKTVVAKKSCLRGNQSRNNYTSRKRKYTKTGKCCKDILNTTKKRKVSSPKLKAKKNSKSLKSKGSMLKKHKQLSSSRSSSKAKHICDKVKKAAEKIRKAKAAKQKMAQKRLKERLKRAAKKKLAMKRTLAKKRKENKQKSRLTNKKRKNSRKCVKPKRKRRRKIKIIPIERELDIVETLRVSLLKYLTFQVAFKHSYECCRKYCWDKWEEVEMEDIIDDHD